MEQALFVPEFARLLIGLDYDMALEDRAVHESTFTKFPIEDPQRSFLMDHVQEAPTELKFKIVVSSQPTTGPTGTYRMSAFYERLLWMKSRQAVSVDNYLTVYTGIKLHQNMAIKSVRMSRDNKTANQAVFDITVIETRFATYPTLTSTSYLMLANDGAFNGAASILVTAASSMITQALRVKQRPRISRPQDNQTPAIKAAALAAG